VAAVPIASQTRIKEKNLNIATVVQVTHNKALSLAAVGIFLK
jgi:hypothetical protein